MADKHAQLWQGLNERQRKYLKIIYQYDQIAEENERDRWRLRWPKRPASEWRWLSFDTVGSKLNLAPDPPLKRAMKREGLIDEGTGSTFNALEARKLIECQENFAKHQVFLSEVQLTKLGRAVARAGLGVSAPKRLPKGQLRERQWEALVAAWAAGEEGVQKDENFNYGGFSWEWTWLRLRDYYDTGSGLIKERRKAAGKPTFNRNHEIVLTDAGREFYRVNWQRYGELYPDVDAPSPESQPSSLDTSEHPPTESLSAIAPVTEPIQQPDSLDTGEQLLA